MTLSFKSLRFLWLTGFVLLFRAWSAEPNPQNFSAGLTARVDSKTPAILLSWNPSTNAAAVDTLQRRDPGSTNWVALTRLPGWVAEFWDTNVQSGLIYEYQVARPTTSGYLYASIDAPLLENRRTFGP
jgi:hypothetical protein